MARFDRINFYKKEVIDGVEEWDLINNDIKDFQIRRPTTFYTIQYDEIQRPDIISIRNYSKIDYWWIILYVNEIVDPFNELQEGDIIRIPNVKDIEDWYLGTRK